MLAPGSAQVLSEMGLMVTEQSPSTNRENWMAAEVPDVGAFFRLVHWP